MNSNPLGETPISPFRVILILQLENVCDFKVREEDVSCAIARQSSMTVTFWQHLWNLRGIVALTFSLPIQIGRKDSMMNE